ncbi:hypothetical protein CRG98_029500 [Punica granatum]|uniref:Integrase catalytic domain-containing protein n=1 Tax=Punica granatum TaxID=22663 RepID=A0A2I0J1I8_PUNGR|nr:hypothetical protein CRG98_029500 [Punica granatum]
MQIEDYLYGKDLWQPLANKPIGMTDAEWNVLDRKAMSVIRLSLLRNVAFHTAKEKTTKGILQVLVDMYEKSSAANKVHLMRRLFNLKMSESTVVAEHLNEFNLITTQLTSVNIDFDDEVYLTDDESLEIAGKGDVRIKTPNGLIWQLRGVRHIPSLKRNLISVGQLDDEVELGLCEDCVFEKQKRVSLSKAGRTLKEQKLELVHSDLWGPAPITSLGGASYYMTFIDDSTRKVWVYFLKRKFDAFDAFRKWKALVENETGLKVKCLRFDDGGEYEINEFKEYCVVNGIRMEKTIRETPQQNEVAERMTRTLNERVRSGAPDIDSAGTQSEHSSRWELAMEDEMNSLMSNSTWELVELPKGKKALHNKWAYRIKEETDGSKRYKARGDWFRIPCIFHDTRTLSWTGSKILEPDPTLLNYGTGTYPEPCLNL